MSKSLGIYLAALLLVLVGWLWLRAPAIANFSDNAHWLSLFGISALYLCSHGLRMLRLLLLTLDQRNKVFPLITAHALTAFPSSFLPFKLGEVLRLAAFFHVFEHRQKALAVWLAERIGDILVLTALIIGLYLFSINVPPLMRTVLILFLLANALSFLGFFAVAKLFIYLNRHLVLNSHTTRGLTLLRISHHIRRFEISIYKSVEGRVSSLLLLSVLIWSLEIAALSLFISYFSINEKSFASLFTSGLLANLPGGDSSSNGFGLYQSLALASLTTLFLIITWLATRFNFLRIRDV